MIKFIKGNIFNSKAEALVNTVNIVGIMGKGIALQFKERFPENFKLYVQACKKGQIKIGKMFVTKTNSDTNPKWIINFPTKTHWIKNSSYRYIELGLIDLIEVIKRYNIKSIAIPPLGSGQGGLNWERVKNILIDNLSHLQIEIEIYEPGYWDEMEESKVSINEILTKPRALILYILDKYRVLGFDITLLEIHKLAYFLQRLGQNDLKLNFKKFYYGPYAHNLTHLLHRLEKKFLITSKPIFDLRPLDIIYFNYENFYFVEKFIEQSCNEIEIQRINILSDLIRGFESPFGLELLASIDWILKEKVFTDDTLIIKKELVKWSKRKEEIFSLYHISIALEHLNNFRDYLGYEKNELINFQ